MVIRGATANQAKACRLLYVDLTVVGIRLPPRLKVVFGGKGLEDDDLGSHIVEEGDNHIIELSSNLLDGSTYFTLAHELGHALGLSHTKKGVMAPKDRSKVRCLTLRNRRKWLGQLMRCLSVKRLKGLK